MLGVPFQVGVRLDDGQAPVEVFDGRAESDQSTQTDEANTAVVERAGAPGGRGFAVVERALKFQIRLAEFPLAVVDCTEVERDQTGTVRIAEFAVKNRQFTLVVFFALLVMGAFSIGVALTNAGAILGTPGYMPP